MLTGTSQNAVTCCVPAAHFTHPHMHSTRAHTHTHAGTRTHTHTHAHTHTHMQVHTHTHTHTHTCTHTHVHTHTHTHMQAHTHTHTHMQAHTHTHTQSLIQTLRFLYSPLTHDLSTLLLYVPSPQRGLVVKSLTTSQRVTRWYGSPPTQEGRSCPMPWM